MLKRERHAYFPDRANLYYSLLPADLSPQITVSGNSVETDLPKEVVEKINSQQPIQIYQCSKTDLLIIELSSG